MKRLFLMGATIVLAASIGRAEAGTPASVKTGPCRQILQACNSAGYYLGGHKKGPNKGEYIDCIDPILKGGSVSGVSVTAEEVSACNAHRAAHASKMPAPPAPAH